LFITARFENEFKPIVEKIGWIGTTKADVRVDGYKNISGVVRLRKGELRHVCVVCIQEAGLSVSSAVVAVLVSLLRPRYLLMLGMCCGLNDELSPAKGKLGDVIVATETACWDEGKYSDEIVAKDPFYVRAKTRTPQNEFRKKVDGCIETKSSEIESGLKNAAESFDLDKIAKECDEEVTRSPKIYAGMMLSGSSVIDSVSQVEVIRKRFPSAIGIEMEAHAIYCAVDAGIGAKPSALVIKGIADHGQGKKNKAAQKLASAMSFMARRCFKWVERPVLRLQ